MKRSLLVKALLVQSIASVPSTRAKRNYLKHADSEGDSDIIITTTPTKPNIKRKIVTGLDSSLLVFSTTLSIIAQSCYLNNKIEIMLHGANIDLGHTLINKF